MPEPRLPTWVGRSQRWRATRRTPAASARPRHSNGPSVAPLSSPDRVGSYRVGTEDVDAQRGIAAGVRWVVNHSAGEPGDGVERAGFLEQVGGARARSRGGSGSAAGLARLRLSSSTTSSSPPTMSSVGARTENQLLTGEVGPAAAGHHGRDVRVGVGGGAQRGGGAGAGAEVADAVAGMSGWVRSQAVTSSRRRASRSMSKTLARSCSSSTVSRSNSSVPSPAAFKAAAT